VITDARDRFPHGQFDCIDGAGWRAISDDDLQTGDR
jgi:hypothetical protein